MDDMPNEPDTVLTELKNAESVDAPDIAEELTAELSAELDEAPGAKPHQLDLPVASDGSLDEADTAGGFAADSSPGAEV